MYVLLLVAVAVYSADAAPAATGISCCKYIIHIQYCVFTKNMTLIRIYSHRAPGVHCIMWHPELCHRLLHVAMLATKTTQHLALQYNFDFTRF